MHGARARRPRPRPVRDGPEPWRCAVGSGIPGKSVGGEQLRPFARLAGHEQHDAAGDEGERLLVAEQRDPEAVVMRTRRTKTREPGNEHRGVHAM